jgi:hypothetical protein
MCTVVEFFHRCVCVEKKTSCMYDLKFVLTTKFRLPSFGYQVYNMMMRSYKNLFSKIKINKYYNLYFKF